MLPASFESSLAQTIDEIRCEIIVVDDGSADGTVGGLGRAEKALLRVLKKGQIGEIPAIRVRLKQG